MSLDPKKLALPVQPIESHKLDLSQRKAKPSKPPESKLIFRELVLGDKNTEVAIKIITDASGGTWIDPEDRTRHRGIGPAFRGEPVDVAQFTVDRANRQRQRDEAQAAVKSKRRRK